LNQAKRETLAPLGHAAAIAALLGSTLFFSNDDAHAEQLLGLAARVCGRRTYTLEFLRSTDVPGFVTRALGAPLHADPAPGEANAR
jgi:hypothetical protein